MSPSKLTTTIFAISVSVAASVRGKDADNTKLSLACPATCHGYTCDDWINNGAGNTCENLQANYGCDCSGCLCGENAHVEDDGRPQMVDPRNSYWSMGRGYCIDETGQPAPYQRLPGVSSIICADRCNRKAAECFGYGIDSVGCLLYIAPVVQADGDEMGDGCFMKATVSEEVKQPQQPQQPQQPIGGQKQEADENEIAEPVQQPTADNSKKEHEPAQQPAADTVALETTELTGGQRFSHPPVGAVDPSLAQAFVFVEKSQTFFLKQRFEPPSYCVDSNEQCYQWASEGYCTAPENSEWMATNCRFSCGLCAPVIQAPANQAIAKFHKRVMSFHGTVDVTLLGRQYLLQKPHIVNKATNLRVTLLDGTILFSIQRKECTKQESKDCRATWRVFMGRTSEKKVLYYGIQRTSTFKFYQSKADFEANPYGNWRAELRQLVHSKKEPASYQVTVMPNEDAGLLLLAAYVVETHQDLVPDEGTSDAGSNNGDEQQ